jgi:SAM-dependent methyltransferase
VVDAGTIMHPRPTLVAGVPIDLGRRRFCLARCTSCGLCFKDPPVPEDALLACYAAAKGDHWGDEVDPWQRRFDVVDDVLRRHARGPRILDVGCSNGALLEYLGDRWERFGVEPSRDAGERARRKGVTILGERLEQVEPPEAFDAILAIDVIEHLARPQEFIRAASARLGPGGVLIVLTGDTDSPGWRLEGSAHWYCSLVEHVTFYNRRSVAELGRRAGLRSLEHLRTYHERSRLVVRASQAVKNMAYVAGRRVGGFGLAPLRRLVVERRAPGWIAAKDHMIHVLQRIAPMESA